MKKLALFSAVCAVSIGLVDLSYADENTAQKRNGVSLRVYDIPADADELPILVPGQTANVNKVIEQVDLDDKRKTFDGMMNHTYAELTGWLVANQAGKIDFQLYHDDGAEVIMDGKAVLTDPGPNNGETPGKFSVNLSAGEHAYTVRLHNISGPYRLRMEWKLPGSDKFELVPADHLKTVANEVLVVSPGLKNIITPGKRPGDRMPLNAVHPSLTLVNFRPDDFKPRVGGFDFLPDGRLVMCTWDPRGDVYIIEGADKATSADRSMVKIKRFATGLAEPLGVKCVGDRIFVLQKQELTELIDTDKDGVADFYRNHCDDWNVSSNFHEFAFGLVQKNNKFYFNLAVAIMPGGATKVPQVTGRGTVRSVDMNGTMEIVAKGLRTPNGIGIGPDDEIFITDNQGDWLPSSTLMHVKPGVWFGSHIQPDHDNADAAHYLAPVLWMPQGEIGNSPSNLLTLHQGIYAGQILHGDVTYGGLQRDFVEKVDGEYQGCIFRFTQGLEGGINRIAQGPDGGIYVGGIGSTGNWGQTGKLKFGLQKLVFNDKVAFEPLAIRAKSNGVEIEFTQPIADALDAWKTDSYEVKQWHYIRTNTYGGPKTGVTDIKIKSASLSEDHKRVFLELDNMQAGEVTYVHIDAPFKNASGEELWNTEGWYTLNHIPNDNPGMVLTPPPDALTKMPCLDADEAKEGFKLIFDGKSLDGWHLYRKPNVPITNWFTDNATLTRKESGGDLVTNEEYGDFDLRLEWKISEAGNSGIIYRCNENNSASYQSGIEYQILDNQKHSDGKNTKTCTAACYAMYAPTHDVTKPVGQWNETRIVAKGNHVDHYLNGEKVVSYDIGTDDWNKLLAASKFSAWKDFATLPKGHIALQDHGAQVWYRNVRIKTLESN